MWWKILSVIMFTNLSWGFYYMLRCLDEAAIWVVKTMYGVILNLECGIKQEFIKYRIIGQILGTKSFC